MEEPQAQNSQPALSLREWETVSALKRGQWSAIEQLVHTYQDRLYAATYRIVLNADDAADLVQESFVRAMQNIASFEGHSSLYTWLFRIAINLALTQKRTQNRRKTVSLDDGFGDDLNRQAATLRDQMYQQTESDPAREAQIHLDHERLLSAMDDLEPGDRALLILRDVEECSYDYIAEILDVPIGTVKSRLFRARMALRAAVEAGEIRRTGKSDQVQP